jgi:MFS family permease
MIYPLLPALITALGGGAISLGLLDGISDAISAGAKLWAGRLADRVRLRRGLVIAGYAIATAARPIIGVAGHAWQVIVLRATDRIGKGIRTPPRDAVIADATSREIRGRAFGFHRSMDHAGAVVGPLVAWALIQRGRMEPASVIRWSVVPGVVAVAVVWFAMRQAGIEKGEEAKGSPSPAEGPALVGPDQQRASIVFYLIVLFSLFRFPETLLLLRLHDAGLSVGLTPLVWSALHVVRTSTSYGAGRITDRLGTARTMVWGWTVYAAVCAGLASTLSAAASVGWFLVFGLVAALTEPAERAFVANLRSSAGTGRRYGVYHASVGVAALAGGLGFGFLYSRFSGTGALAVSAVGAGLLILSGAALLGWTMGSRKGNGE